MNLQIAAARGTALLTVLGLCTQAEAQRVHVDGLIGEAPDVSNWPHPAAPDANPYPRSTATSSELKYRDMKADLGKILFWEEQASSDNTMSCGTCHSPAAGGTDIRPGALHPNGNLGANGVIRQARQVPGSLGAVPIDYGFQNPPSANIDRLMTGLHTPTMVGSYVFERLFWNMRAGPDLREEPAPGAPPLPLPPIIPGFDEWAGSEDLSIEPMLSPVEMAHEDIRWDDFFIQKKLGESFPMALVDPTTIPPDVAWIPGSGANYAEIFDKIFSNDPDASIAAPNGVTRTRWAMAVAHYMRELIPDKAPIDTGSMNPDMMTGFNIMSSSGCFVCHSTSGSPTMTSLGGILADPFDNPLSDGRFHNIGFGSVKTPTLRNVGLRKRFFSTGRGSVGIPTFNPNSLESIIRFYDLVQGGVFGLNGSIPDPTAADGDRLTDQEFKQVFHFLNSGLTDKRVALELFPFDRPELASERSDFNPFEGNEYGTGTAGASGLTPEIIANAVPVVTTASTDWFKVGVGNTVPNAAAGLLVSTSASFGPTIWVGPATFGAFVTTNNQGIGTGHTPIPLNIGTVGLDFFVQWQVADGFTFAFSDAAKFTPFIF